MSDEQAPDGGRPHPATGQHPSYPGAPADPPSGYGSVPPSGYGYPAPPPGAPQPYGPPYYVAPPKHPSSVTAMVLGIVAVAGGVMCYLPLLAGPFACWLGRKAMREIDASQGQLSGRSEAKAGFVLGIIGTVLLVLALALIALLVVLTMTVDDFWDEEYALWGLLG